MEIRKKYHLSKVMGLKLVFLVVWFACAAPIFSQGYDYSLSLRVEHDCLFQGLAEDSHSGTLTLYKSTMFEAFGQKDSSLQWPLDLAADSLRIDSLERWTYMIEYVPFDTNIQPSKRSIHLNVDSDVYLDCQFFNTPQESFSSTLKSDDCIIFCYATPFNPFFTRTGHETVDYNYLVIQRKKRKYYAYYSEGTERLYFYGLLSGFNSTNFNRIPGATVVLEKELRIEELEQVISFEESLADDWFETMERYPSESAKFVRYHYILRSNSTNLMVDQTTVLRLKNLLWGDD